MADSFKAVLRNVRVSPRKARLVVDLVRGKPVSTALDMLRVTNKKTAPLLKKLIHSAMAGAVEKATVNIDRLIVSEVFVDAGVTLKRFMPRAQGRATPIRKRSSHITIKLREI
ncbi:MAG: 50S ribosomal protein L22 [Oligoflexales bacterium]